jgi:hypothetical protein
LSELVSTLQLCRKATEGKDSTLPTEKDYFNFAESKREAEENAQRQRRLVLSCFVRSEGSERERGRCVKQPTNQSTMPPVRTRSRVVMRRSTHLVAPGRRRVEEDSKRRTEGKRKGSKQVRVRRRSKKKKRTSYRECEEDA